jgi:hypothetical protein
VQALIAADARTLSIHIKRDCSLTGTLAQALIATDAAAVVVAVFGGVVVHASAHLVRLSWLVHPQKEISTEKEML